MAVPAMGVFLGLTTMDIEYLVTALPRDDEKIVALDHALGVGGPATNAARTYCALGGESVVVSAIGSHPVGRLAKTLMHEEGLTHIDLTPSHSDLPPVSSILVNEQSGSRSVTSVNATKLPVSEVGASASMKEIQGDEIAILLVDGHQINGPMKTMQMLNDSGATVVLDGGSWKEGLDSLLPIVDIAICSEGFTTPRSSSHANLIDELHSVGVRHVAVTRGEKPILYSDGSDFLSLPVGSSGRVVDTLGAGDILHGAFCYFHGVKHEDVFQALMHASQLASDSCRFFGVSRWLETIRNRH